MKVQTTNMPFIIEPWSPAMSGGNGLLSTINLLISNHVNFKIVKFSVKFKEDGIAGTLTLGKSVLTCP